jgi:hypothetical protein
MSKQIGNLKWRLAGVTGLALLALTCAEVPMTAPAGTSMFLQANPSFVVANGGTSVITALLTEEAGTLVPDGTVVMFFTTLGRVDAQGQTKDGVAKVNFVADSRSGQATVTAYSGGPAPAPSASPTASGFGSVSSSAAVRASAVTATSAAATATGTGSASITIDIGSTLPTKVVVTADPPFLATSRQSTITANVFDTYGNPVQNVPVIFKITSSDSNLQESLASGGSPQYTDSNGQALDTLVTRTANGVTTRKVTVSATIPSVDNGTVDVVVYYTTLR